MEPATVGAIERLIRVARGNTHQSRYAAILAACTLGVIVVLVALLGFSAWLSD